MQYLIYCLCLIFITIFESQSYASGKSGVFLDTTYTSDYLYKLQTDADSLFDGNKFNSAADNYKKLARAYELKKDTLKYAYYWELAAISYSNIPNDDSAIFFINKAIYIVDHVANKTFKEKETLQKYYVLAGKIFKQAGYFEKSLGFLTTGLNLINEIKGTENLSYAIALDEFGSCAYDFGKIDTAMLYWDKSLVIKKRILQDNDPEIGKSYYYQSFQYTFRAQYDSSIFFLQKALDLTPKSTLDRLGNIHQMLGFIYSVQKKHTKASEHLEKAIELKTLLYGPGQLLVADSYTLRGVNNLEYGWCEMAIRDFKEALAIYIQNYGTDHYKNHSLYAYLSITYLESGDFSKALVYANKALEMSLKKYNETNPKLQEDYFVLGRIMSELNLNDSAFYFLNKAISISKSKDENLINAFSELAKLYDEKGNKAEAYESIETAIKLTKEIYGEGSLLMATIYLTYAKILNEDHQFSRTLNYLTLALSIGQRNAFEDEDVFKLFGETYYIMGYYTQAKMYFSIFNEIVKGHKFLRAKESSRKFAKMNATTYINLFKTEYHLKNNDNALSWLDRTKSNDLISKTYEKIFLEIFTDSIIKKSYYSVLDSINCYSKKIASAQENKELAKLPELSYNLIKLNAKYENLKTEIIDQYPNLKTFLNTDSVSQIDLNKTLNDNEAFVYYFAESDSLWITIASKDSIRIFHTPCNQYLDHDIHNYNNLIQASASNEIVFEVKLDHYSQYFTKSHLRKLLGSINYAKYLLGNPIALEKGQIQLICDSLNDYFYRLLISPVEKYLPNYYNLVIVPDNILSFMPFASLYKKEMAGKHFLVEDHNLRFAQSARLFSITQKRALNYNKLKRDDFFAMAISNFSKRKANASESKCLVNNGANITRGQLEYLIKQSDSFDYDFQDLPFAIKEVENIANLFNNKPKSIYNNQQAVEKKIWMLNNSGELAKNKILHFATHAIYNNRKIDNTCMVLFDYDSIGPRNNTENDGYLTIPEIIRLKLKADLVVLSACETAQGESLQGEGVYGMPYAFLLAGANNVISSLWSINDKGTEAFFIEFYSHVRRGESYNEALNNIYRLFILKQKGQLNLLKVYSKEMEDILNNSEYLNPFFWAAFVLW